MKKVKHNRSGRGASSGLVEDESGQMLLATGIVLLMSLLSMSTYGTSLSNLGQPYDSTSDEVVQTSKEVNFIFEDVVNSRASELVSAGVGQEEAVWQSVNWTADDLLHHGEIRGVEIKVLSPFVEGENGLWNVTVNMGIADRHARLEYTLTAQITL